LLIITNSSIRHDWLPLNCWIHAGLYSVVSSGRSHLEGFSGGLKRSGGESANGIPKYLLTMAVAEGSVVDVPIIIPESILAVGDPGSTFALVSKRMDALMSAKEKDVVHILVVIERVEEQRNDEKSLLWLHI
jgi:hypothetical protein